MGTGHAEKEACPRGVLPLLLLYGLNNILAQRHTGRVRLAAMGTEPLPQTPWALHNPPPALARAPSLRARCCRPCRGARRPVPAAWGVWRCVPPGPEPVLKRTDQAGRADGLQGWPRARWAELAGPTCGICPGIPWAESFGRAWEGHGACSWACQGKAFWTGGLARGVRYQGRLGVTARTLGLCRRSNEDPTVDFPFQCSDSFVGSQVLRLQDLQLGG